MKKILTLCSALCVSLGASAIFTSHASAQMVGSYAGTAADNSGITLVVSKDTANNVLAVTGASIFFNAVCKKSTTILSAGWGYGLNADISAHQASNETAGSYFDIAFTVTFSRDGQSATGTVSAISPDLQYATNAPPATSALFCTSKKQKFSLSFQNPAVVPRLPAHYAVMLAPH